MSSVAPDTLYLQWHGDGDPEIEDGPVDPGDVTWCVDRIFDNDIEYRKVVPVLPFGVEI